MFTNKVTRNATWIILEQIFHMMLTVIVSILSARYLGPDNYGALSYTASFVTFFSAFASLGMDGVVLKKMIESPNREGEYLGSCIVFRMISSLFSSIAIFGIITLINPDDKLRIFLAGIQSFQLILQASHLFNAWFQRYLGTRYRILVHHINRPNLGVLWGFLKMGDQVPNPRFPHSFCYEHF